jgi:hypothetical protein
VGGIFLLKFSTEMLIRRMNGTLTHNVLQIGGRFNAANVLLVAVAV